MVRSRGALNDIPKVVFSRTLRSAGRSLLRFGVVDEYRLLVLPAAAGQGHPLFTGLDHPLTQRLLASRAFPNDLMELVYSPS